MITRNIVRSVVSVVVLMTAIAVGAIAAAQTATSRKPATLKPGQTFSECRNCPEMVVVPAGSFVMGSPADEPERRENEPQVRISIPRALAIGKTEVTWDQWEACVRD